ncbi:MAG: secretin N-terminal domain-containing protein, partial [Janthinobacterium sp.]
MPIHNNRKISLPIFARRLLLLALTLMLTACGAAIAFREGRELLAQDKAEDALLKFEQASKQDPGNLEYRKTLLQMRERIVYTFVEQAEQALNAERYTQAKQLYERTLNIDPSNEQARAGLRKLPLLERQGKMLEEAQDAFNKKNYITAQRIATEILETNSRHQKAQNIIEQISQINNVQRDEIKLQSGYKKNISIEFKEAPLRQIFDVISRSSGLNFIFDKDVKTDQRASIFLKNSTIESAIHFTLLTNQLEQQILDSNTILIYPNTPAKQKDYQEMIVRSFFLTNADAKTVATTLKTIVKSKDIVVDEKLNLLIVRDSPDAIKLAEKLVALHDVAEPEVMLEVEILEIKRTRLLDLGIQWPTSLSLTPLPSSAGGTLTLRDLRSNLNSATLGASIGAATVRANKEDGDTNLLANPRIRARNHEKAKILIGERVPNITTTATSTGFVSESINYIEVGLKLDVEPTVYLDNDVAIKVALEVSSITNQIKTQSGSLAYQIGTRTASTTLRLKNGETQILAGLINDEERRSANKIPGLGELPVIGRLFGSQVDDNQKTEIVLSITPHLIRNIQAPDASVTSFRSGTDNSFRVRNESLESNLASGKNSPANQVNIEKNSTTPVNANNGNNGNNPNNSNPLNNGIGGATGIGIGAYGNAVAGAPQLNWQGPRQVKIGETFSLQLIMQSDQPVVNVPLTIGFDSQILQVVNVAEGIFLKQGGAQTTFNYQVDPKGQITTSDVRSLGGASSPGNVLTISFQALAP